MARKKAAVRSPQRAARPPALERRIVTTTVRIYKDQRDALQRRALDRRDEAGGAGRADASAVLRDLLDTLLKAGA